MFGWVSEFTQQSVLCARLKVYVNVGGYDEAIREISTTVGTDFTTVGSERTAATGRSI